ncbi:MAG: hypothetical protein QOI50_5255, partial [Pseudonocardiales bacterium]|nr:hypothetical protein [Pseudonocardiales bacterium]
GSTSQNGADGAGRVSSAGIGEQW